VFLVTKATGPLSEDYATILQGFFAVNVFAFKQQK
jgi:hypothetical protein